MEKITIEVEVSNAVSDALDALAEHEGGDMTTEKYIAGILYRHVLPYLSGRIDGCKEASEAALTAIDTACNRVTTNTPKPILPVAGEVR